MKTSGLRLHLNTARPGGRHGSGFRRNTRSAQRGLTLIEMIVTIVVLGIAMAALASFYPFFATLPDAERVEKAARNAESCAELIIAASRTDDEDENAVFDPHRIKDNTENGEDLTAESPGIGIAADLWNRFCGAADEETDSLVRVSRVEEDDAAAVLVIRIGYEGPGVGGLDPLYVGFDADE
ncbi:type II secretion system protein [Halorhodospira halophila]|uniref:Prepilin-type N-terminal cleavage/methylation domain-containing protein n=1 Tax=Halorhodospira halophila (strain DSM 244 / SL1) TaxID=349124 RepID=A1WTV0_HALHL|nr:type II secretion system protein [Halorhodospira halophila]ABM61112.1 hypothetical protein Hhal_0318 [Halorhodospira halophila SL1]MBK1729828.1 prepilin-type cleavage/methylation domain-containing protein [Halorhodospira halophila]